jgi:ribosomal protein L32E
MTWFFRQEFFRQEVTRFSHQEVTRLFRRPKGRPDCVCQSVVA